MKTILARLGMFERIFFFFSFCLTFGVTGTVCAILVYATYLQRAILQNVIFMALVAMVVISIYLYYLQKTVRKIISSTLEDAEYLLSVTAAASMILGATGLIGLAWANPPSIEVQNRICSALLTTGIFGMFHYMRIMTGFWNEQLEGKK